MPNRPTEYWKAVIHEEDVRTEKIFCGRGGRKRALQYAARARRKSAKLIQTEVFSCIPSWELVEVWSLAD